MLFQQASSDTLLCKNEYIIKSWGSNSSYYLCYSSYPINFDRLSDLITYKALFIHLRWSRLVYIYARLSLNFSII